MCDRASISSSSEDAGVNSIAVGYEVYLGPERLYLWIIRGSQIRCSDIRRLSQIIEAGILEGDVRSHLALNQDSGH